MKTYSFGIGWPPLEECFEYTVGVSDMLAKKEAKLKSMVMDNSITDEALIAARHEARASFDRYVELMMLLTAACRTIVFPKGDDVGDVDEQELEPDTTP